MGSCLSSSPPPPLPVAKSGVAHAAKSTRKRRATSVDGGRRSEPKIAGDEVGEDEVHRIPERLFLNGCNEVACLHTQQGRKGANQDAMIVWKDFMLRSDTIFCGIFDGHGPYGHLVAKKVRDSLPLKLSTQWRAKLSSQHSLQQNGTSWNIDSEETASGSMDDEWIDSTDNVGPEKVPQMYLPLKQIFLKAFRLMDNDLKFHPSLDCFCSGCTAVTLVKQGNDLIIGNVGDSRAIIGTRDKDKNLVAVQLTVDLKPNLPREAARIQLRKGRVFALQDEPEVARVWLPNNDSPGLAMARAFGDFCLKDYGLISVPDITYRHLTENDEFIVMATDGVWDVLSNKEVVDIVASAPTRGSAARALVDCAVQAWQLKFPTSRIDDCAVVCLYLESPSSTDSSDDGYCKTAPNSVEMTVSSFSRKHADHENQVSAAEGAQPTVSKLEHSCTLREADVPVCEATKVEGIPEKNQSTRSLADCISTTEDEEWSALDGVTRVNSLVNLPRFLSNDKKSSSWMKWF